MIASVSVDDADVVVGDDGSLANRRPEAHQALRSKAGFYNVLPSPAHTVFLKRADTNLRLALAGEISDRGTLLEIVQFVASVGWVGELAVATSDVRRSILFDGATVLLATSTAPGERLGEVLYRHGAITRAQFDEAIKLISGSRRIGDIVVQKGWIKPNDLYGMLQKQVKEIFFNALSVASGFFYFARGIDAASLPVRVNLTTGALLMEGVQRIDEWAYFREKIADSSVVPQRVEGKQASGEPGVEKIWALIDGKRTLDELARISGLGEFESTKSLYAILQSGAAKLRQARSPKDLLEEQIDGFNSVLEDIHATVDGAGVGEGARTTLSMFLQGGGAFDVLLVNAGPRSEGSFDKAVLMTNLSRLHTDDPGRVVQQALHDYVAFALFAAGSVLKREEHQQLARRVQAQMDALRVARP
jgi:hypothetical protein